jgi:hypothetical protein
MRPLHGWLASLSAATGLLAAPSLAPAAIPTGSFEIEFGGNQSIWAGEPGVDEGEEFCNEFEDEFDALDYCDFDIFVDGKGKVFGYFGFAGWTDGLYFDQGGEIRGTQRGDDRTGISRLSLKIKLRGTATDGFDTLPTRSTIRLSQQITAGGVMTGVWSTRVCIQYLGCNEVEEAVPPEIVTNGEWSLELEITDEGDDELGGGARVEFGDGNECYYSVIGKYSSNKGTSKLRLYPVDPECWGTSLRLKDVRLITGPPDEIEGSIAYRLFGFRGDTEFGVLARLLPPTRQPFPVFGGVQGTLGGGYIPISREEIVERQWALIEELQAARIEPAPPLLELPLPSFGRRDFVWVEPEPYYYYYGSASVSISVITPAPIQIEERPLPEELEP